MAVSDFDLETLWATANFKPTKYQEEAIRYVDGPLFLPAGPGSGKTRVLLWRTLNLLVFYNIKPDEILLTTFTEKAALQLKEGLRSLLGIATSFTGKQYDISEMYIGTVHSVCNRILTDRRFMRLRRKADPVSVMDALEQYFYFKNNRNWNQLVKSVELSDLEINTFFDGKAPEYANKHRAILEVIALFNRFSEENLNPDDAITKAHDDTLRKLLYMYKEYLYLIGHNGQLKKSDLSLIQVIAYRHIIDYIGSSKVFKHVIVDEYQDTNSIQEKIFFHLAGNHNICVVGDDDQALYRFRGATVENFVDFPQRCQKFIHKIPKKIPLNVNYRSRSQIVDFYCNFIDKIDWKKDNAPGEFHRVIDKEIQANSNDKQTAVITTGCGAEGMPAEIARFVRSLIDSGKVKDPNQIAFLYPSLKVQGIEPMIAALENEGLRAYAPRARRFLEVNESVELFGIFTLILGRPERGEYGGREYAEFHQWLDDINRNAKDIVKSDYLLAEFIQDKRTELESIVSDYVKLTQTVKKQGWTLDYEYNPETMLRALSETKGLSEIVQKTLFNPFFNKSIKDKLNNPSEVAFTLSQVINRLTSLDWSLLDIFYQLCGFENFKKYFDLAEQGTDEGPIVNLAQISQYISKFMDIYTNIITADFVMDNKLQRLLFVSYLYAIFRLGESEVEDEENPFPKGRIPFITIHQSKGLEFPVVFLNPYKQDRTDKKETILKDLVDRQGEPIEKMGKFDSWRVFYVGLSRAENLLIIPNVRMRKEFQSLVKPLPTTTDFDINSLPSVTKSNENKLSKPYSYTADYLSYNSCPRQYMVFRRYGFVPSRSQTMFFGSLVHKTIDDLHNHLIALRNEQ